jgi:hypothetical protein
VSRWERGRPGGYTAAPDTRAPSPRIRGEHGGLLLRLEADDIRGRDEEVHLGAALNPRLAADVFLIFDAGADVALVLEDNGVADAVGGLGRARLAPPQGCGISVYASEPLAKFLLEGRGAGVLQHS